MVRGSIKSKLVGAFIVFVSLGLLTYVVLDRRDKAVYQPIPVAAVAGHHTVAIPQPVHEAPRQWLPKQQEPAMKAPVIIHPKPIIKPKPVVVHIPHHAAIPKPRAAVRVYWLQVASYHAVQNARLMRRRLLHLGYPSRIDSVHVHGAAWYRLNAGPFASQREAQQAQRKIRRKWKLKTHIRVKKG